MHIHALRILSLGWGLLSGLLALAQQPPDTAQFSIPPSAIYAEGKPNGTCQFRGMEWNTHKVYPYAVKMTAELRALDAMLGDGGRDKALVERKKDDLFAQYEAVFRGFSQEQGRIFCLLMHRFTGKTVHQIVQEKKGWASAQLWGTVSGLQHIDLREPYEPKTDICDWTIEWYAQQLDAGCYNKAHRQPNFRLP